MARSSGRGAGIAGAPPITLLPSPRGEGRKSSRTRPRATLQVSAIGRSATKVTTRKIRSDQGTTPPRGPSDYPQRTPWYAPVASREFEPQGSLGGIADDRELLRDEDDGPYGEFSTAKHRTNTIVRAIACCILLLSLPACGIPPRRLAQKPPALPESFNGVTSPENSSQLGVVEFYHDPMLLSLIDQALASNRQLKILNEGVQIASNEILARSGAYLPFLTLG